MNMGINFKKNVIDDILKLQVGEKIKITSEFISNSLDDTIGKNYTCGIDCYCPKCKENKTFIISSSDFYQSAFCFIKAINSSFSRCSSVPGSSVNDPYSLFLNERGKFDLELKCPVCNEVIYFYYIYENGYTIKINTYPNSMNGLKQKYRKYKLLNNDDYDYAEEFITGCYLFYNSKSGIGSFCYLRRCLENFVKDYTNDLFNEEKISEKYNASLKFEQKINIIKDALDKDVYDMLKPLYSILSLGIHELKEDECLAFFEQLRGILEIILDERLENINKKKMIQELKKNLNDSNSKLLAKKSNQ